MEPTIIVQNRPANESATRAPISGVKFETPLKLARVLDAFIKGTFSTCVRYVIKLL